MLVTIPAVLLKTSAAFFSFAVTQLGRLVVGPEYLSAVAALALPFAKWGQRLLRRQVQVSCPPGRSASGAAPARRGAGPGTPEPATTTYYRQAHSGVFGRQEGCRTPGPRIA
jgi:hypothetical protein